MERIFIKLTRYFGTWQIGIQDPIKETLWTIKPIAKNIPYLKFQNAGGRHIFIQPSDESCFLMVDDLTGTMLEKHHQTNGSWKPGRLVIETSPANYQCWIHASRPLAYDEKKYWLERLGSDPEAGPRGRWGRCPGFRNRKDKYQNELGWPLSKLIWIDWRNLAKIPLLSLPEKSFSHSTPSGESVSRATTSLKRSDYDRGNDSKTDFAYALALLRRGVSEQEVKQRLLDERTDWMHHKNKEKYLDRSIAKAKSEIQKRLHKNNELWRDFYGKPASTYAG